MYNIQVYMSTLCTPHATETISVSTLQELFGLTFLKCGLKTNNFLND